MNKIRARHIEVTVGAHSSNMDYSMIDCAGLLLKATTIPSIHSNCAIAVVTIVRDSHF